MKTRILMTLLPAAVLGCNLTLSLGDYALEEGALCQDGIKNQGETGIDCGGPCLACADNQGCMVGTDCASLVCEGNLCRPPSCNDGIQNGDELGVDCRGTCIDQKCKAGEACNSGIDCIGGECNTNNNICEASCTDNTQNGLETGLDCGGGLCGACANGLGCALNRDCESEVCSESFCVDYHRFSYGFGEVYSTQFFASTMMVDSKSDDRIAVGGSFIGSFDFGKGFESTLMNDYSNVYLAQFDGSGNCLWSNSFGDATYPQIATAISANANGDMAMAGWFFGSLNFGGGLLPGDTSKSNAFIVVLNSMGQHQWSRSIGGTADDKASGISINVAGEVLAAGFFTGSIDVGGKSMVSVFNSPDIYLVRYQNNGTALWAKSFGDGAVQYEPLLAENTSGTTVLAGKLNGSTNFGGNTLIADPTTENIYIAALNKQGAHIWSKNYAHTMPNEMLYINDAAVDENNNTTIIGTFTKSIQLETQNLASKGQTDIFVARFDPNGTLLWANAYGNTDFDEAKNLDITPDGSLLITGIFVNTIDFGGHTLNATGNGSAFILKLSTDGKHIWSHAFGNNKNIAFPDISPQGNHNQNIVSTSVYSGSLNYGGPELPAPAMGLSFGLAGLTLPLQ